MSQSPNTPPASFRQWVAQQFSKRPSLRDVIATAGYEALATRYPWTRKNHPQLKSIEGFTLLHAATDDDPGQQSKLLDTLLDDFLNGRAVALASSDQLSVNPPKVFRPQEQGPAIDMNMADLNEVFDDMLATLNETFQQAQISYWNGCEGDSDVSRLRWLQQLLKAALLAAIERQGLDDDEKGLLYALARQGSDAPAVQGLQVSLGRMGHEQHIDLPDLLITAERDERRLVLWCQPSGTVRSFDTLEAFACALRDELADEHVFDAMTWACSPVNEDAFGYQARQMLNAILQRLDRVQLSSVSSVDELEAALSRLSDPSSAFPASGQVLPTAPAIPLPGWLSQASDTDRFQYHSALLELSASEVLAQGTSSLDGIEDLQHYAASRLRERMLKDHPGSPPYDPDQLLISISQLLQGSSLGQARLEHLKTITLTELAIARLQPSEGEVATAIRQGDGQAVEDWMNLDYLNSLIVAVDVGGQYPKYVHARLQDPGKTAMRVQRFASEWRSTLLLSALKAKIEGQLGERTWHVIAGFCRGRTGFSLNVAPLAFNCVPGSPKADRVQGMFVLEVPATGVWVLYQPMVAAHTIRAFESQQQLMAAIRSDSEMQQGILAWLDDHTYPIYANDGFSRPHLHTGMSELAQLLGPGVALSDAALERLREPATLAFTPWSGNLDSQLFRAKADAMLLLASRQSVSNAEQRWALIVQCAWLAFNTVAPLLRGPAGTLIWLVATLITLKNDLEALAKGTTEERLLASADVLLNLAMLLIHKPVPHTKPELSVDPSPRQTGAATLQEPPMARDWQAPNEKQRPLMLNVSHWGDNQRLGNLPMEARHALATLRAKTDLRELQAQSSGRMRGLYKFGTRYYVKLQEVAYEVEETWDGIRIIGPDVSQDEWTNQWGGEWDGYYIPGRERSKGPWITRWNGEWALDLRLAGGMPKTRNELAEANKREYLAMQARRKQTDQLLETHENFIDRYLELLKDFDTAAAGFKEDMKNYPGVARNDLPEPMQARLRALHAMRNKALPHFQVLTLTYEKQANLVNSQLELFTQMSEPRFARFDYKNIAPYARGQWWEQMLNTDLHLFHRLLDMTDYEVLRSQARELGALPFGDEQALLYLSFSQTVEAALATHKRALTVSERLDQNLSEALADRHIQFEDKQSKLDAIINLRQYSSVLTRAQVLSDLNQLMVNRSQLTADNFDQLLRLQANLRNRDFNEALLSHDGLAAASLPFDEQAEILGTALREYEISLGKAEYLQSLDDPTLDSKRIEEYIRELSALKSVAERDLSIALSSQDAGAVSLARQATYRARPGKRKLIRTTTGRAILAEQGEDSGDAVQTDPMTEQAVAHYQQRGTQWEPVPHAATPHGTAYLRRVGSSLLAQKDQRIALASRYSSEPDSLADLMDWHIQDMTDVAGQLHAGPEDGHPLAAQLNQAAETMQAEKRRLLTSAYLNSQHPDSRALRYLLEADEIDITPTTSRKRLKERDYLDVYVIHRKQPRQKLWEAHFHYTSAEANSREFAKGHLKFWEPRAMSRDEQLQRSLNPAERIRIYRGDLRLEQVEGLIPFPGN